MLRNLHVVCNNAGTTTNLTLEELPSPNWKVVDLKRHLAHKMDLASSSSTSTWSTATTSSNDVAAAVGRIRLIFRGQPLQDDVFLSSINGLSDDTTMHMLVRPAISATTNPSASSSSSSFSSIFSPSTVGGSGTTSSSSSSSRSNNNTADGATSSLINQILGGLAGATGSAINTTTNVNNVNNNNNGGDLGSLLSGLVQGVLSGVSNGSSSSSNNNANANASNATTTSSAPPTSTRTTTIGNTTIRVHDLTGGSSSSSSGGRGSSSGAATAVPQQQQQQASNIPQPSNRTSILNNVALPSALVHVHVTPDQLEALPEQLARFYENFSRRTGATSNSSSSSIQPPQVQVEEQIQSQSQPSSSSSSSATPLGNFISGISRIVTNAIGGEQLQPASQNIVGQDAAPATSAANRAVAAASLFANVTPARPFVSQANLVPLQDRVTNAVKDTVTRHGVGALLPLINGNWEPLALFRMPIESALRQPYMTSASRDSVAAALVAEFQQAASSSGFSVSSRENPLYRVLETELAANSGISSSSAASSAAALTSPQQVFDRIQNILLESMLVDGLALVLPANPSSSSSSISSNNANNSVSENVRWSTQVRNLVVRSSGRVVNVLRDEANLSPESIASIVREVANIASPILGQLNPMMAMMVQSQGPVMIQQWSDEYNANPGNYAAAPAPAPQPSSANTASQNQQQHHRHSDSDAEEDDEEDDDDDDSDLDALLSDALNDITGTGRGVGGGGPGNSAGVSAHVVEVDTSDGADVATALSRALRQVEGLDASSIQSILQLTGQALSGNNNNDNNNNNTNNSRAPGYFY